MASSSARLLSTIPESPGISAADLEALGVFDHAGLVRAQGAQPEWLVEGLIRDRSINLLVGDSGLGKTPLAVAVGIAVASGTPFLGNSVSQGPVLYCDGESGMAEFRRLLETLSRSAGLAHPPPCFRVWSPNWEDGPVDSRAWVNRLVERVKAARPRLVIVDPKRAFWPMAEEKTSEATKAAHVQRELSREIGCSFLSNHHRRKRNSEYSVNLDSRHLWFEEAAGSLAIVNSTDTRLGFEECSGSNADLRLAGFVRSLGWVGPFYLQRLRDEDGEPVGYKRLSGAENLSLLYGAAFETLPARFRFTDAQAALGGKSGSNTAAFLSQCRALGLVRKDGKEYVKVGF